MNAHVLLVDNYDSFTYNLVQALRVLGADVSVFRNDHPALDPVAEGDDGGLAAITHVVVSSGPGRPEHAGRSLDVVRATMPVLPVLGVCLGHQAIGAVVGLEVGPAAQLMHGKTSRVYHDDHSVYRGLPNPFQAGRYHSLAVSGPAPDDDVVVCSYTADGEVMGIRHKFLPTEGIQFHPESVLTPDGERLLENFLRLAPPRAATEVDDHGGDR